MIETGKPELSKTAAKIKELKDKIKSSLRLGIETYQALHLGVPFN